MHKPYPGEYGWADIAAKAIRVGVHIRSGCVCGNCLRAAIASLEHDRVHSDTKIIVEMTAAEFAEWESFKEAKR